MCSNDTRRGRRARGEQSAVALVLVLFSLVIISILTVGFFSLSTANRQMSFGSLGQTRAQLLAQSALNGIVADMRDEMAAGSDVQTVAGNRRVFTPRKPETVGLCRNSDPLLVNLLRTSKANDALWTGAANYSTNGPMRSTTKVASTSASGNGRSVTLNRWLRPALVDSTNTNRFVAPDWFLMTRGGPLTLTAPGQEPAISSAADASPSNPNFVIGRYAYAIYDVGGLLDINVAGNALPASLNNEKRGRLHQADLTKIPGITAQGASDFLEWRSHGANHQTGLDDKNPWFFGSNDYRHAFPGDSATPGGDNKLISRQDLIRYSQDFPATLPADSLSYLTVFTREKNAASSKPATVSATNPFFPAIRRADTGKEFQRFPLSHLGLLTTDAVASTSDDLYKYFGLTRSAAGDPWVYNHGNPAPNENVIMTLAEVALAGRDPDFFELLKAAILSGSLAATYGNPVNGNNQTGMTTALLDSQADLQILRIGACIIDQYDADSFPTAIKFLDRNKNETYVYGVENLPYLNRFFTTAHRPDPDKSRVGYWLELEVWNPHQNPPNSFSSGNGPTVFRAKLKDASIQKRLTMPAPIGVIPPDVFNVTETDISNPKVFTTFNLQSFAQPELITSTNAARDGDQPDPEQRPASSPIRGLFIGWLDPVIASPVDKMKYNLGQTGFTFQPNTDNEIDLEYLSPSDGKFHVYQRLRGINSATGNSIGTSNDYLLSFNPNRNYYFWGDPRNQRFGAGSSDACPPGQPMWGTDISGHGAMYANRPADGVSILMVRAPATPSNWMLNKVGDATHARWTTLINNDTTGTTSYLDPDGTRRLGDGGLRGADDGNPYPASGMARRPVVLNRPFRSVGELGYAFRDLPWKTLDLFTKDSADAALLDVFSLSDGEVVAGKINLNTRQPAVLQAMIAGAAREEANSAATTISTASSATLANDIVTATTMKPLLYKGGLVTGLAATTSSPDYPVIKTQREAVVRALGEAGQTRTWNLLVDVIAQSGRYAPNASNFDRFIVEGERRYWLHLAIDRFTGEVVDQQLEAVFE